MSESEIQVPTRCPECGTVALTTFPVLVVATALTAWYQMRLHCDCHRTEWDATVVEIQSMRTFLGKDWLDAHMRPPMWDSLSN